MTNKENTQKILVLTGASRGIGHATVKRFSEEGWRVITCSRQPFPETALGQLAQKTTYKLI